jgi:hypothetical protein
MSRPVSGKHADIIFHANMLIPRTGRRRERYFEANRCICMLLVTDAPLTALRIIKLSSFTICGQRPLYACITLNEMGGTHPVNVFALMLFILKQSIGQAHHWEVITWDRCFFFKWLIPLCLLNKFVLLNRQVHNYKIRGKNYGFRPLFLGHHQDFTRFKKQGLPFYSVY